MLHLASSRELPLDNMVAKCHFSSVNPHLISVDRGCNEVQTTSACGPVARLNLRAAWGMTAPTELEERHFSAMGLAVPKCYWGKATLALGLGAGDASAWLGWVGCT